MNFEEKILESCVAFIFFEKTGMGTKEIDLFKREVFYFLEKLHKNRQMITQCFVL
jgi:hypothetical protein